MKLDPLDFLSRKRRQKGDITERKVLVGNLTSKTQRSKQPYVLVRTTTLETQRYNNVALTLSDFATKRQPKDNKNTQKTHFNKKSQIYAFFCFLHV